ncbi:MAG: hypothetical protein J0I20_33855 [Chloroflexi bacterium]|nr:hypothetical protein [Chloroflexota bacterium]OJW05616.1 MAG: hypothetical protein BGO39_03095 [Chloroflexi bacterium 54-19]
MEVLKQLLAARKALDEAKAAESEAQKNWRAAQERALEYFADNGLERARLDGMTIYHTSRAWVKVDLDQEGVKEVLDRNGLGYLVKETVNTNSLSSWYSEQRELGTELSPELLEVLTISETPEVRVRKAS